MDLLDEDWSNVVVSIVSTLADIDVSISATALTSILPTWEDKKNGISNEKVEKSKRKFKDFWTTTC